MKKEKFTQILKEKTNSMFNDNWYEIVSNLLLQSEGNDNGYVYFIKPKNVVDIKIGFSKNINSRISTYRTNYSCPIILVGYIFCSDYKLLEKDIHEKLKDYRVSGEWFSSNINDIKNIIDEYKGHFLNTEFSRKSFIDENYFFNLKPSVEQSYIDISKIDKNKRYNYKEICELLNYDYKDIKSLIKNLCKQCQNEGTLIEKGNSNGSRWVKLI
jgi:hypothetical protein